jgi:hypothetical protein
MDNNDQGVLDEILSCIQHGDEYENLVVEDLQYLRDKDVDIMLDRIVSVKHRTLLTRLINKSKGSSSNRLEFTPGNSSIKTPSPTIASDFSVSGIVGGKRKKNVTSIARKNLNDNCVILKRVLILNKSFTKIPRENSSLFNALKKSGRIKDKVKLRHGKTLNDLRRHFPVLSEGHWYFVTKSTKSFDIDQVYGGDSLVPEWKVLKNIETDHRGVGMVIRLDFKPAPTPQQFSDDEEEEKDNNGEHEVEEDEEDDFDFETSSSAIGLKRKQPPAEEEEDDEEDDEDEEKDDAENEDEEKDDAVPPAVAKQQQALLYYNTRHASHHRK